MKLIQQEKYVFGYNQAVLFLLSSTWWQIHTLITNELTIIFLEPYCWVSSAWSLFPRVTASITYSNGRSIFLVTVVESVVLTLDRFCHTRLYLTKCVSRNPAKICVNDSDTKFFFLGCHHPPSNGKGFPSWSGKAENTELPRSFFDYSPAKKSINAHSVL